MSGRQKRLKAELTLGSASCLALVVGLAAWMGAADLSFQAHPTLAAVWWGSLLLGSAFGVGACRIDDDSDEAHYLSSIVAGIRQEWKDRSLRH
ncbi:hypothetical protein MU582_13080 [Nocardioidaceae bacterium SCSIO 66511]|nr:hypothetical protein MU582_13080 [Nocardioidaceae bacterium SCSIO 66511]